MGAHLPKRIPLFPLPSTVAFPCVPLPLHIFESRYREMVADALKGPGVIGMTLLRPGWESDYEGRPPIYEVGCAGIITQHEALDGGRFNIVLLGQGVFELEAEEQGKPYRIGVVKYRAQVACGAGELKPLRAKVIRVVNAMAKAAGSSSPVIEEHGADSIPDEEFVNFLCHMLGLATLEKQALLETEGPKQRYEKLIDILDFHRLGAADPGRLIQ
jgi:uncharacterized protein